MRATFYKRNHVGVSVIDADSTLNSEVLTNVGSMSTDVYAISLFVWNMVEISSFWFFVYSKLLNYNPMASSLVLQYNKLFHTQQVTEC